MAVIYNQIAEHARRGDKMLVRLIDPDKFDAGTLSEGFDYYFVGGSSASGCTDTVRAVHQACRTPVVLFPGSPKQFTPEADALLFLTLMNSRDPQLLIDPHVMSAGEVMASGIETIPMGYILVDGGRQSTTERLTGARPLPQTDIDGIVRLAQTAQLLGKQLVYLEAGSGAKNPVQEDVIRAVREAVQVPLIVGGGIRSVEQMNSAYRTGADIVVIGNYFEEHPEAIPEFMQR
ncbi:MAG: geranylgeranylglyceryl/heptaprenylglyceryl phosphate synthase [Paludibacteraceae bacterium]|nr:geranylgeranylglyceryl/heptaprenylglyceryl phosphate synthase [Paludibacteraceae bacterium]